VKQLFNELIQCEAESEIWRIKLFQMKMFNVKTLFNSIKKYGEDFLLMMDFEVYISDISKEELLILFRVFDRNRDNKITYYEVNI
jgi:Ca2+-binding EF-hand superfamily protein